MIRKVKGGYRVVARSGRNMGTYRSKAQAKERLRQVEVFKAMARTRGTRGQGSPSAERPDDRVEYTTRGVLAGAYRGGRQSLASLLTHTVAPDKEEALCGRAPHMGDALGCTPAELRAPPTCKACLRKDPRFRARSQSPRSIAARFGGPPPPLSEDFEATERHLRRTGRPYAATTLGALARWTRTVERGATRAKHALGLRSPMNKLSMQDRPSKAELDRFVTLFAAYLASQQGAPIAAQQRAYQAYAKRLHAIRLKYPKVDFASTTTVDALYHAAQGVLAKVSMRGSPARSPVLIRPGTRGYIPPSPNSQSSDRVELRAVTGKTRMMLRDGVGEPGPKGYGVKTPHLYVTLESGERVWEPLRNIRWSASST